MRMLEGSNDLRDITHIVLDEVHERTIDSDFLLIVLRKLLVKRPDLKVRFILFLKDRNRFELSKSQWINQVALNYSSHPRLSNSLSIIQHTLDWFLHCANLCEGRFDVSNCRCRQVFSIS